MKIVSYEPSFGEVKLPEGFAELLHGRTIEEQMACYRTTFSHRTTQTGWRERRFTDITVRIEKDSAVTALIVKGDLLVGVMVKDHNGREVPCLAEEGVCTYYACDNNGAGYKERIDNTYLICVSEDFLQDVE